MAAEYIEFIKARSEDSEVRLSFNYFHPGMLHHDAVREVSCHFGNAANKGSRKGEEMGKSNK